MFFFFTKLPEVAIVNTVIFFVDVLVYLSFFLLFFFFYRLPHWHVKRSFSKLNRAETLVLPIGESNVLATNL